jgi:hypothetical protein
MKDFIPYEEALELKQLRFDEPCFTWYWDDIGMYNGLELGNHNKHINYVSAPLFSQAFRFFREKYGLHQYVEYIKTANRYDWWVGHTFNNTKTYEEAELACLRRLIEIAKAKQTVEDYYANGLKESEYEGD